MNYIIIVICGVLFVWWSTCGIWFLWPEHVWNLVFVARARVGLCFCGWSMCATHPMDEGAHHLPTFPIAPPLLSHPQYRNDDVAVFLPVNCTTRP